MSLFYLSISYENSDHPTFEDLNPPSYSFSDQRYRGNDERTVEDEEQNSKGDLGK